MTTLVLTAHGSADPRSAANTRAVAGLLSRLRPGLDVRVAFLERNAPTLGDVLAGLSGTREAVVTPLLLADAYHARIDIPGQIARSGAAWSGIYVRQADALGEDDRLVSVLRDRLAGLGVSRLDDAPACSWSRSAPRMPRRCHCCSGGETGGGNPVGGGDDRVRHQTGAFGG